MDNKEITGLNRIRYAYIVGIGRSGTTLLSKLLNRHRNCLVSLEIDFIIFFMNQFGSEKKFTPEDHRLICDFFELYSQRHPMLNLVLDTKKLYEDLCTSNVQDYNSLTKLLHLKFNFFSKPIDQIEVLVDKNPSYTLHTRKLLAFSPEAKFIYMVRDYRANILSRKQSIESRSPDTAFNCYRWLFYNRHAAKEMKKQNKIFHTVRYEDLVTNNPQEMIRIYQFLGLSAHDNDMGFYSDDSKASLSQNLNEIKGMKERYKKTFSDIEKPVFTDRIEKWKQDLSEPDIAICETICGSEGEKHGYKTSLSLSSMNKFVIRVKSLPAYLRAVYDYRKEFLLYRLSPIIKMKRIRQKNKNIRIA